MFPVAKLLPLIVSVCATPSAVMLVGLMLLTVGTITAVVTVTAAVPDEQSAVVVALDDRHTRT